MSNAKRSPFNISVLTNSHRGKDGNIQVFKSIKLVSPTTATNTFDGVYFSDWMLLSNGSLFISEDASAVDYSAEYEGEDISLILMTHILLPPVDDANMPLAREMAEVLRNEISCLFEIKCDLPIVEFDHADVISA